MHRSREALHRDRKVLFWRPGQVALGCWKKHTLLLTIRSQYAIITFFATDIFLLMWGLLSGFLYNVSNNGRKYRMHHKTWLTTKCKLDLCRTLFTEEILKFSSEPWQTTIYIIPAPNLFFFLGIPYARCWLVRPFWVLLRKCLGLLLKYSTPAFLLRQ